MIYFDYAATTPLDIEALDVYVKAATEFFGNSNSLHDVGSQAADLLENCRDELAGLLGINRHGLYFTSGGSEGNFLAIEALLSAAEAGKNHIITSAAEHSSIHGALSRLEKAGYTVTYLPFNSAGIINLNELESALKPETALICIQHVNSEIGTIQPIEKIAGICRKYHLYFHSDFVQSFGKLELKKAASLVNSFSFSGHKIYGPKGIGGVYIDPAISWNSFFPGSTHEKGLRPGTVNVPAIAAMTVAAEKITGRMADESKQAQSLREIFLESITPIKEWVDLFGTKGDMQLPGIIGLGISGIEGQWLMLECNRLGFAISTGSACQAGMQSPSKTMLALGLSHHQAKEFIRISFGRKTTSADVQQLGEAIVRIVKQVKSV